MRTHTHAHRNVYIGTLIQQIFIEVLISGLRSALYTGAIAVNTINAEEK